MSNTLEPIAVSPNFGGSIKVGHATGLSSDSISLVVIDDDGSTAVVCITPAVARMVGRALEFYADAMEHPYDIGLSDLGSW